MKPNDSNSDHFNSFGSDRYERKQNDPISQHSDRHDRFKHKRVVMCLKDFEVIYGRKAKAARRIMNEILAKLNKTARDPLSVPEFCRITQIPEEVVYSRMR